MWLLRPGSAGPGPPAGLGNPGAAGGPTRASAAAVTVRLRLSQATSRLRRYSAAARARTRTRICAFAGPGSGQGPPPSRPASRLRPGPTIARLRRTRRYWLQLELAKLPAAHCDLPVTAVEPLRQVKLATSDDHILDSNWNSDFNFAASRRPGASTAACPAVSSPESR